MNSFKQCCSKDSPIIFVDKPFLKSLYCSICSSFIFRSFSVASSWALSSSALLRFSSSILWFNSIILVFISVSSSWFLRDCSESAKLWFAFDTLISSFSFWISSFFFVKASCIAISLAWLAFKIWFCNSLISSFFLARRSFFSISWFFKAIAFSESFFSRLTFKSFSSLEISILSLASSRSFSSLKVARSAFFSLSSLDR